MAILNFPDAAGQPIDGSFTYEDNGVLYSWDGYKWNANSEQAYDDKYVEVTGDTMTGDLTVPSLNGSALAGLRNQLINGDFYIAQRATSLTTGNGYKTCDRWYQESASGNVQTKRRVGFRKFASAIELKDATSSGDAYIAQGIELPFTGYNGPFEVNSIWTVSFWSTVAPSGIGVAFRDSITGVTTGDTCPVGTITAGETIDGYTHYSAQATITTASSTRTCLRIKLAYTTPVDTNISGVQFEPGPVATPFEHRPYGLELSLCQRYYYQTSSNFLKSMYPLTGSGNNGTTVGYLACFINTPVIMRATPSVSGLVSGANPAVHYQSPQGAQIYITAQASTTARNVTFFTADAEL